MSQETPSRTWTILGIGILAVVGLVLLLISLERGPGEPAPTITSATPSTPDDPIVTSVNGRPIEYSFWMEAVLLDQVMSELARRPAPKPSETLQRLVNEALVLDAVPPEHEPTAKEIEAHITALEQSWQADDAAVVARLEQAGLTRTALEQTVGRLLKVQANLEMLQSQGHDTTAWLEEQRANAEIVFSEAFEHLAMPPTPVAQSPTATPIRLPTLTPTIKSPIPSPTPALLLAGPASDLPTPAIPEVAPDFTLERAGGAKVTLTEQLAQGPVVLVFFQRCG